MEIRTADVNDLEEIYDFNQRMFPDKVIDSKEYISFWLSKSKDAIHNILLLLDDSGRIVGQSVMSDMSYYYQGERMHTVWGFDLIIEEKYRDQAWGIDLMMSIKELFPHTFATGSGPLAKAINIKLGMKSLGEIKKYAGIVGPFLLLSYKKSVIPYERFPESITVGKSVYHKASLNELPSFDGPFNSDLFEISRDREFLEWRFFNGLHSYIFYLREDNHAYFVLRSIDIKSFRVMELVDYRCENSEECFEEVFHAASKITRKVHLSVLICGSSLASLDAVLERHHFKSIGRPRPILGYHKCREWKQVIENRNYCFVTLADSDGETNWR